MCITVFLLWIIFLLDLFSTSVVVLPLASLMRSSRLLMIRDVLLILLGGVARGESYHKLSSKGDFLVDAFWPRVPGVLWSKGKPKCGPFILLAPTSRVEVLIYETVSPLTLRHR